MREITGVIFPEMCSTLYDEAVECYDVANYDTAISDLEQVIKMEEGYNDGAALLLLAQAYEGKGEQDKANQLYQKLIESYADTEAATSAQDALDVQNGKKTSDDTGDSGDGDVGAGGDDTYDTGYIDDGTYDGNYE